MILQNVHKCEARASFRRRAVIFFELVAHEQQVLRGELVGLDVDSSLGIKADLGREYVLVDTVTQLARGVEDVEHSGRPSDSLILSETLLWKCPSRSGSRPSLVVKAGVRESRCRAVVNSSAVVDAEERRRKVWSEGRAPTGQLGKVNGKTGHSAVTKEGARGSWIFESS